MLRSILLFVRRRRVVALGAFLFAMAGCGGGGSNTTNPISATGRDLPNPPEIVSTNGVAHVSLTAVVNPATGGPAIQYEGALVPPTIRVAPGDTIDFTYSNQLPVSSAEPLNSSNIHFHGFATSPNPPADDSIDLLAMPGQTLHYVVPVPKTQPPGLYFYHSHAHGEANWQLYNGMSGAIVVTGTAGFAPETAGLPERVIVLRNVLAQPDYSALSNARRLEARRRLSLGRHRSDSDDGICEQPWGIDGEYTTVNGRSAGVQIFMQPSVRQLWRVVNASADGYFNLSVDGQTLHIVAIDGVPLKMYPGSREQDVPNIVVPPAGRVEFTLDGPLTSTALRTTCYDTGPDGDPNPSQVLATIVPGKPTLGSVALAPTTAFPLGTFQTPLGAPTMQRTLSFTEDNPDSIFYLNGTVFSFTAPPMFTVQSGTVERWTLENGSEEVHAFHIHQLHFIVQDVDGVPQPPLWRDTVSLPIEHADGTPSVSHVLLDFRDPIIRGQFLFHCHLLEHEDDGMMAKIVVQ